MEWKFLEIVLLLINARISLGFDASDLENLANERLLYGNRMASYMNPDVDPCEDFYEYSCGNFFKENKITTVRGRFGSVLMVHENVQQKVHELLMEPINSSSEVATAHEKARIFYQSCMKADIFPYKKSNEFLEVIESMGGWPVIKPDWKPEDFDWINATYTLKSYGKDVFFSHWSGYGGDSAVYIHPSEFGLISMNEYLHRPSSKEFHMNKELAKHIMVMYGVPKVKAINVFNDILQFGNDLVEMRNTTDEGFYEIDFEGLSELIPEFDWINYFRDQYNETKIRNITFFVEQKDFIKQIPTVFNKENIKRATNYFMLKAMYNFHTELQVPKDQKKYCIQRVGKLMSSVVISLFMNSKNRDKDVEDEIMTMSSYIKSAFRDKMRANTWMGKDVKKGALNYVQSIGVNVGEDVAMGDPDLDLDSLPEKYTDLDVSVDRSFNENHLNALRFIAKRTWYEDELEFSRIAVNAFYGGKFLEIPSGILQRPFYYPELPKSYNFGAIGAILGHEFSHSIDGGQTQEDWWTEEANIEFMKRVDCLINQYDQYRIEEINENVRGNRTIGDNIADNEGLKLSFYAYKKWLTANLANLDLSKQVLPGLNITDDQQFFLSFGQLWCEKVIGFNAYKTIRRDVHSPGKWRVIGSVTNFDEFAKAFDCKPGSPMNPIDKCILW